MALYLLGYHLEVWMNGELLFCGMMEFWWRWLKEEEEEEEVVVQKDDHLNDKEMTKGRR